MTNYIGHSFAHHGLKGRTQKATVITQSEPKGKRGKVLVTVRLENGEEFKMDPSNLPTETIFAAPVSLNVAIERSRGIIDPTLLRR